MPNPKLAPCPFCGGDPSIYHTNKIWHQPAKFTVTCLNENCYGYKTYCKYESKEKAILIWNSRSNTHLSLIGELAGALKWALTYIPNKLAPIDQEELVQAKLVLSKVKKEGE